MKIKEWLYNIFHFNKQERNGVFILCSILFFIIILKWCLPLFNGSDSDVHLITINTPAPDTVFTTATSNSSIPNQNTIIEKELFVFNPNTVSLEDAEKLGFSKKLASTLINFRNKGGKFFKSEDLKKLYGLPPQLFNELESYILIPNKAYDTKSSFKKDTVYKSQFSQSSKPKQTFTKQLVDLNSADSLHIVYLKGIGPSFTKRILKYRNLLGGFHSLPQLKSIYGMTDSLYNLLVPQIMLNSNNLTKIPINQIDINSLRKHPYFNYSSAQAIINFRSKHGKLSETNVVALGVFDEQKLQLILPYLSY